MPINSVQLALLIKNGYGVIKYIKDNEPNITILDLNNSQLETGHLVIISKILEKFPNITSLNLGNNRIRNIDDFDVGNLQEFDISGNYIDNIEDFKVGNLRRFSVDYNRIRNIANFKVGNLQEFDIGDNLLTDIDKFEVGNLQRFNVSENEITDIANFKVGNLRRFNVSGNLITNIDKFIVRHLQEFKICGNKITNIAQLNIRNSFLTTLSTGTKLPKSLLEDLEKNKQTTIKLIKGIQSKSGEKDKSKIDETEVKKLINEFQTILQKGSNFNIKIKIIQHLEGANIGNIKGNNILHSEASKLKLLLTTIEDKNGKLQIIARRVPANKNNNSNNTEPSANFSYKFSNVISEAEIKYRTLLLEKADQIINQADKNISLDNIKPNATVEDDSKYASKVIIDDVARSIHRFLDGGDRSVQQQWQIQQQQNNNKPTQNDVNVNNNNNNNDEHKSDIVSNNDSNKETPNDSLKNPVLSNINTEEHISKC